MDGWRPLHSGPCVPVFCRFTQNREGCVCGTWVKNTGKGSDGQRASCSPSGEKRPDQGRNRLPEARQTGTHSQSLCLLCFSLQNGNHTLSFTQAACANAYKLLFLPKISKQRQFCESTFPVPHDGIKKNPK